jgi:hypothetical protein
MSGLDHPVLNGRESDGAELPRHRMAIVLTQKRESDYDSGMNADLDVVTLGELQIRCGQFGDI